MNLELAITPEELAKGLQFREEPPKGGMLLCFDKPQKVSIHMHNVKFPLDITFLDKDYKPLKKVTNAQPETEGYTCDNVNFVLETASQAHQMKQDSSKQSSKGLLLKNKYTVKCQKCRKAFDYSKVPEVCMGGVECPHCGTVINQNGEYHKAARILKEEDLSKAGMIEYNWAKNSLGEYEGKSGKFTALNDQSAIKKAANELTEVLNKATGLRFIYKIKEGGMLVDQFGIFLDNKQYARGYVELHLKGENYTAHYGLRLEGYRVAQRGMPEDVQKARLKGYEQVEIMDPKKRDWIDDEAELGVYGMDEKRLKNLLGKEPTEEEEDIEPSDLGIDMTLAETRLDSTQKYLPAEQKLYRDNYWKEKRMTHKIIDQILKEAGIDLQEIPVLFKKTKIYQDQMDFRLLYFVSPEGKVASITKYITDGKNDFNDVKIKRWLKEVKNPDFNKVQHVLAKREMTIEDVMEFLYK